MLRNLLGSKTKNVKRNDAKKPIWKWKVWWQDATLFIYFSFFITYIHSFNYHTFIRRHSLKPLSISSSLVCSVGETSLWGRAENRTRACLTASRRAANWATPPHKWNKCDAKLKYFFVFKSKKCFFSFLFETQMKCKLSDKKRTN